MTPGLTICMTRDTQNFVLIHNCVHPTMGCSTEYGLLTKMTAFEMEWNGLAAVLHSLQEYAYRRKAQRSELESLPVAEQDEFDREHKQVRLSLPKGAELSLAPMHFGKRGGKISGDMLETQIVKLPTTPEAFFKALTVAMALAD